tara:strand:+ start:305 stop:598 length:294 start_codon:yes stop_codon:yes gene_type:complete
MTRGVFLKINLTLKSKYLVKNFMIINRYFGKYTNGTKIKKMKNGLIIFPSNVISLYSFFVALPSFVLPSVQILDGDSILSTNLPNFFLRSTITPFPL